jgi:hypothetical protein
MLMVIGHCLRHRGAGQCEQNGAQTKRSSHANVSIRGAMAEEQHGIRVTSSDPAP